MKTFIVHPSVVANAILSVKTQKGFQRRNEIVMRAVEYAISRADIQNMVSRRQMDDAVDEVSNLICEIVNSISK